MPNQVSGSHTPPRATAASQADATLIDASRQGDTTAFGLLVTRYQSLICSIAYNQCGDLAASEDFAQEAFLQAWRKLADLREANSFKAWLCTIVRNVTRRAVTNKAMQTTTSATSLDAAGDFPAAGEDPAEQALSTEREQLVWSALAEIPENYREPLILYYREEKSVLRVAEALDISPDAVKQRLSRGRKMLHAQMVAAVESVLETSKPSNQFASSVVAALAAGGKTAAVSGASTAAATTSAAAKGLFWLPLAQLPLAAWLFRIAVDETRSQEERELVIRHQVLSLLGLIPMCLAMWLGIRFQQYVPLPSSLIPAACMVLFMVPMIYGSRKLGVHIEKLREQQGTATPPRDTVLNQTDGDKALAVFLGSGVLVAVWPTLLFLFNRHWVMAAVAPCSALLLSLAMYAFRGTNPKRAYRVYGVSLGLVSLLMIGLTYFFATGFRSENWTFWYLACLQAVGMTNVLLLISAWRRIFGKAPRTADMSQF